MSIARRFFSRYKPFPLIPEWQKSINRDPFDYRLRTRAEVEEEKRVNPPIAVGRLEVRNYSDNDPGLRHIDFRDSVVRMTIDMRNWHLTPLQKERLIFLLGSRYKNSCKFRVVVRQYPKLDQNMQRCLDIIQELWLETKRAP